jgi:flagellar biosynthetic protein FliP
MTTTAPTTARRSSVRPLVRHYLEMVVAMFAGMLVLGALRSALGLTVAFATHPGTSYVLMATDMALGMAAWMRFRGHGWGCTVEMCAAMYVPALLLPLVWSGVLGAMAFMVLAHVAMLVGMLAVLVRRRAELAEH